MWDRFHLLQLNIHEVFPQIIPISMATSQESFLPFFLGPMKRRERGPDRLGTRDFRKC